MNVYSTVSYECIHNNILFTKEKKIAESITLLTACDLSTVQWVPVITGSIIMELTWEFGKPEISVNIIECTV